MSQDMSGHASSQDSSIIPPSLPLSLTQAGLSSLVRDIRVYESNVATHLNRSPSPTAPNFGTGTTVTRHVDGGMRVAGGPLIETTNALELPPEYGVY